MQGLCLCRGLGNCHPAVGSLDWRLAGTLSRTGADLDKWSSVFHQEPLKTCLPCWLAPIVTKPTQWQHFMGWLRSLAFWSYFAFVSPINSATQDASTKTDSDRNEQPSDQEGRCACLWDRTAYQLTRDSMS